MIGLSLAGGKDNSFSCVGNSMISGSSTHSSIPIQLPSDNPPGETMDAQPLNSRRPKTPNPSFKFI